MPEIITVSRYPIFNTHCFSPRLMSDIGRIIGKDSASARYAETADFLHDNGILDGAHWSEEHGAYLDYGLHTERVILERPREVGSIHM